MSELLANYLCGQSVNGTGAGTPLFDPVLGTELVRVDAGGLDLAAGFDFARTQGGPALRAMTYAQRGKMLAAVVAVLQANRDAYYDIALQNSGTVKNDSAVDIDGGIYTLGYYAKMGDSLGDKPYLLDGDSEKLGRNKETGASFEAQHILVPTRGVALFINAFNFPSWGLWEKAAPALLSGVPVIIKPATSTAWLTQRMVADVVAAGVLPAGALSVICGTSSGLMDQLQPFDVVSFTGSADTAAVIRSHPAVVNRSVRVNIEADSVNSAFLLPDADANADAHSDSFKSLVREVVNEMRVKSGQKCTAIRRIFVPEGLYSAASEAISAKLATLAVGNPRNENVKMGALVSRSQFNTVKAGLAQLQTQTETLFDGNSIPLIDVNPAVACVIAPTLLGAKNPAHADAAKLIHTTEVFGPVATLIPYQDLAHAHRLIARGEGSLVASVYSGDAKAAAEAAIDVAYAHGRVHVITPDVAQIHTGHGNVMPQTLHGGPGRAGGGEELGGKRGLAFYHRRSGLQIGNLVSDFFKA
jgi:3,4-dehydroadipyl-CoA semialdehyde dehydrogenase